MHLNKYSFLGILTILIFSTLFGCESVDEHQEIFKPNKITVLSNIVQQRIDTDTLIMIDKATDDFCECFRTTLDTINNKYRQFNYCTSMVFNNLEFSNFYDALIFGSLYLKNPEVLCYMRALFMLDEDLKNIESTGRECDLKGIEQDLIFDIRRTLNLSWKEYLPESIWYFHQSPSYPSWAF